MAASTGMDRYTGKVLTDWPHVVQSIETILSTAYGDRVMRRDLGSAVPMLLGRNMVVPNFILFFQAIAVALLQEPRVRLRQVVPISVGRDGRAGFRLDVEYRPRGHLGDFTPAGFKSVDVVRAASGFLTART